MHNKGNLAEETIIELVMISIIALAFFAIVIKVNDNSLYQQKQTARDLSFVMDAVGNAPNPWLFTYVGKKDQNIEVKEESCKIKVTSTKKENMPEIFFCSHPLSFVQKEQKKEYAYLQLGT